MAGGETQTVPVQTGIVVWAEARKYLDALAVKEFRLAAGSASEFERGKHAGKAEMAESLRNLPEALAVLAEEDQREDGRRRKQG